MRRVGLTQNDRIPEAAMPGSAKKPTNLSEEPAPPRPLSRDEKAPLSRGEPPSGAEGDTFPLLRATKRAGLSLRHAL